VFRVVQNIYRLGSESGPSRFENSDPDPDRDKHRPDLQHWLYEMTKKSAAVALPTFNNVNPLQLIRCVYTTKHKMKSSFFIKYFYFHSARKMPP
jgi:hypothetical protein